MESQSKAVLGVMEGVESKGASQKGVSKSDLLLRVLALVLTLTAAIVLGVDKQTTTVPVKLVDTLPAVNITVVAKWSYLSAFVYLVVANAVASSYAALSLILSIGSKKCLSPIIITLDLLMVALLFSSNGAAMAIGFMGYKGNSHVGWKKSCNVFGKFCNQVAAASVLSLVGSLMFVLLVALASLRLHKKSK
uniref:CASP-like protein n=2 Tax=Rhizophora mucronata TaxID=61149 RepID=A0A2P2J4H1_RHIMU